MNRLLRTLVVIVTSALALTAGTGAFAQQAGHLGVPGVQMVRADLGTIAGLPAQHYYLINVVRPDGVADTLSSTYLVKQTLVFNELTLIVVRRGGVPVGYAESGEIYLGSYDSRSKGRPLNDQAALLRYTMPASESRLVLRVPLEAGRAFSAYQHPVVIHYGPPDIDLNVRAHGYVASN